MIIARSRGSRTTRLCRAAAVNSDLVTDGYVLFGGHFHLLFFLSDEWTALFPGVSIDVIHRCGPTRFYCRPALVAENMKMVE